MFKFTTEEGIEVGKTVIIGWCDVGNCGLDAVLRLRMPTSEQPKVYSLNTTDEKLVKAYAKQGSCDLHEVTLRCFSTGVTTIAINTQLNDRIATPATAGLVDFLSHHGVTRVVLAAGVHFPPRPPVDGNTVYVYGATETLSKQPRLPELTEVTDPVLGGFLHYLRLAEIPFDAVLISTFAEDVRRRPFSDHPPLCEFFLVLSLRAVAHSRFSSGCRWWIS